MTGVSSVFTNKQEDVFPQCTSLQLYTTPSPSPPPPCVLEIIANWENVKKYINLISRSTFNAHTEPIFKQLEVLNLYNIY